jgi:hypothetical protein
MEKRRIVTLSEFDSYLPTPIAYRCNLNFLNISHIYDEKEGNRDEGGGNKIRKNERNVHIQTAVCSSRILVQIVAHDRRHKGVWHFLPHATNLSAAYLLSAAICLL